MMPAGKYWIGDLCYVMHDEWDEFCDLTISGYDCLSGEFALKDGRRFATYQTMYGDGCYPNTVGKDLGVDAGLIGCIRVEDIDQTNPQNDIELGVIFEFERPFETKYDNGTIHFGDVKVFTNETEYEDEAEIYEDEDY